MGSSSFSIKRVRPYIIASHFFLCRSINLILDKEKQSGLVRNKEKQSGLVRDKKKQSGLVRDERKNNLSWSVILHLD